MLTLSECEIKVTAAITKTRCQAAATQMHLRKQIEFLKQRIQRSEEKNQSFAQLSYALNTTQQQHDQQQHQLGTAQQHIDTLTAQLANEKQINEELASNFKRALEQLEQYTKATQNVGHLERLVSLQKGQLVELNAAVARMKTDKVALIATHQENMQQQEIEFTKAIQAVQTIDTKAIETIQTIQSVKREPDQCNWSNFKSALKQTSPKIVRSDSPRATSPQMSTSTSPVAAPVNAPTTVAVGAVVSPTRTTYTVTFRGSLGVQIGDVGVIEAVNVGSQADDAGVQVGDQIVNVDSVPLGHVFAHTDRPNAREVGSALNRAKRQQGFVKIRFRPLKTPQ
jgi:hypothetical protein